MHGLQDAGKLMECREVHLRHSLRVLRASTLVKHPFGHLIQTTVSQSADDVALSAHLLGAPLRGLLPVQRMPPIRHYYESGTGCFMRWVPNRERMT